MNVSSNGNRPIVAFLPCRKGSERVPRKNVRPFGPYQYGLVELKLKQLLDCRAIDTVVLSTNDKEIIALADNWNAGDRLRLHHRDEVLASSTTSTDALVRHAYALIAPVTPTGHILWTHVTSPFVTARHYEEFVKRYLHSLAEGADSLMTTTPLHAFLWGEDGPINYDRRIEKWPRTQTLQVVHEVNSAAFLASVSVYEKYNDRIGQHPQLFALNRLEAHDIDWEEDFIIAEQLLKQGLVQT